MSFFFFSAAYEEQELTMTVFSDQDNSVISGNGSQQPHSSTPQPRPPSYGPGGSVSRGSQLGMGPNPETQSNAYATINKFPMGASMGRRSLFNGSLGFVDGTPGGPQQMSPHMQMQMQGERDYATLEKMSAQHCKNYKPHMLKQTERIAIFLMKYSLAQQDKIFASVQFL